MKKRGVKNQFYEKHGNILLSFSTPKTPRQAEKELGLKKIKTRPLIDKGILTILNPNAQKGRLYIATEKITNFTFINWDLIGWVISSPKQRFVILKTIAMDSMKRTSEVIRHRASKLNECLTRISTKEILKELTGKDLVKTKMGEDQRRYYWISDIGKEVYSHIEAHIK